MAGVVLPELDVLKIRRYAEAKVPEQLRDQIRVEVEVRGRAVTIVERRPPWRPEFGPEWSRSQCAQLRYDPAASHWTLHWSDRNERWHLFDLIAPAPHVDPLLDEVETDPTSIFWG